MGLPNFIIIGGMKCGTTSLHHYLGEHPEIQPLPGIKETNFFSGPADGIPYPPGSRRIAERDEYEALFDDRYPVRGEASPCYTLYPRRKGVPERMSRLVPDAKLIYLVRDPIARAVSQYHFSVSVEGETRPMEQALLAVDDPVSLFTCPGLYAMQLERYLRQFSQNQILVVDQADLHADRRGTLSRVFAFLGVDDGFFSARFAEEFNVGSERRAYSRLIVLQRRLRRTPLARLPRSVRRPMRRIVERCFTKPLEREHLTERANVRLSEFYAADVERLRAITGMSFDRWLSMPVSKEPGAY